jgi:hypothetical protein
MDRSAPAPDSTALRGWLWRFASHKSTAEVAFAACAVLCVTLLQDRHGVLVAASILLVALSLAVLAVSEREEHWTGHFLMEWLVLSVGPLVHSALLSDGLTLTGAALTAIAVAMGDMLKTPLHRLSSQVCANMPGVPAFSALRLQSRVTHSVIGAAVAATAVGATWSPAVALAAGLVAVCAQVILGVAVFRGNRRRRRALDAVFTALEALRPVFYLMWDAPSEGHSQVTLWLPYLKRVGLPFAVITRTAAQLEALRDRVDVPVVFCSSSAQIERTIVPSLRAVFYVNTALRNAHFLRFSQLRHIQLNHGDSDKPASASKQFRAFDVDFIAGRAAVERFQRYGVAVTPSQLRIVGRPQVEDIAAAEPARTGPRTVLYAPTWGGFFGDSDFSSLVVGERIVKALVDVGCRVIFRPHAFTDRDADHARQAERIRDLLAAANATGGIGHVWGDQAERVMSLVECFNASDAMIADVSSIVTDYLFSEKPLAMVCVGNSPEEFAAQFPVARAAYLITPQAENVMDVVHDMLGDDRKRAARLAMREYYLGDFAREGYSEVFVRAAREECLATPPALEGEPSPSPIRSVRQQ